MFNFGKVWGYLAAAVAAVVGVFLFRAKNKSDGRSEERAKQQEKVIEAIKEKSDLDRELVDSDARAKLREKHYRD